ncbi:Spy/CpxP family protein refolding chaperone [Cyanobacteria bacterium FACHB-472]|nr:Spy/CpxP family protein refolding chaperone [Cyanobacteria bacterium FACHB-472]
MNNKPHLIIGVPMFPSVCIPIAKYALIITALGVGVNCLAGSDKAIALDFPPQSEHLLVAQRSQPQLPQRFSELNLNPRQESQIADIQRETRSQIMDLLTQRQKEQYRDAIQSGKSRREAIASLNLSSDKQSQLRDMMRESRSRIEGVLTPAQQRQLQQNQPDDNSFDDWW